MIKVTLEFDTQEALVSFFSKTTPTVAAKVETPKPVAKAEKAAAPTPSASATDPAKVTAPAAGPTESPKPAAVATAPAPAAAPAASSAVDYPTLQKAVFALANKSREAAGEVAGALGVKTFKELAVLAADGSVTGEKVAGSFASALAAVNAKLAELEVA
ncbi:hypothetical protein UFOVP61_19 [uncultured Caudovirales phage]|uniref:Uncharacterized protein n=1 Tax=uncultured Caudovirales phage TaxID=2100421 RepID=A0A6J5KRQ1_9CAUD|nr:hypothetical protein UFOVP61_19 [uncultured Caudovirales phage]